MIKGLLDWRAHAGDGPGQAADYQGKIGMKWMNWWPGNRLRTLAVAGMAGAALWAAPAQLQAQTPSVGGGAGVNVQHFTFTDGDAVNLESITLLTVPMAARVQVGGPFRVEASTTFARGSLSRPGGESVTLSGLTDTRVQALVDLVPDRVTVSGAVAAPTGADGFTAQEAGLAGAIAADLLPFQISSWGSGGGVGGGISLFQPVGSMGLGFSAGYMVPGEFTPVEETPFQYRPGAALSLQGLIDYTVARTGRMALQVTYNRFEDDEVDGTNLFRTGDRLQLRGSYSFAAGAAGSGVAYAGYLHRSEGTFLDDLRSRPSQGLYFAGAGFRQSWRGMVVVPSAELRVQRRDDGEDQGTLGGVGLELEVPAGGLQMVPSLRLRGGSVLIRDGVESGVLGGELGLTIRRGSGL